MTARPEDMGVSGEHLYEPSEGPATEDPGKQGAPGPALALTLAAVAVAGFSRRL